MKYILALIIIAILAIGCGNAPSLDNSFQQATTERPETVPTKPAPAPEPEPEPEPTISEDVQSLLDKASKAKSISYTYKGPETGDDSFEISAKGDFVAHFLQRTANSRAEDGIDTVFFNKQTKTAEAHCLDRECPVKGKKEDVLYSADYIDTPYDWINRIQEATVVGEERIDRRDTSKIETNVGTMWIDEFFGLPLKVVDGSREYQFLQMKFNTVKDEEVQP